MKRKPVFDPNDPYSAAITSLVKKTLIVLGILLIVGASGIGYIAVKSGLKMSGKSKAAAPAQAEVLSAQESPTDTPVPITPSPLPSPTLTSSPLATPPNTPSPTPTSTSTPTLTPSPSPTLTPSPTATPTPQAKTKVFKSVAALDGYISAGSATTNTEIHVGSMTKGPVRGFLTFDISSSPEDVSQVKMRLYQAALKNNPFQNNTDIRADLVNYGSSLDSSDYTTSSLLPSFTVVSANAPVGWRESEVTTAYKTIKSQSKQYLQFRLHSNFESEGQDNYALFESSDNSLKTNNLPELVVETK